MALQLEKPEGGEYCQSCGASAGPGEDMAHEEGCLMGRYSRMEDAENQALDERLPPGAREREEAAVNKARAVYAAARELLAAGMLQAVGYRVLVKPLEVDQGLEAAEAERYQELARRGFTAKTHEEAERQERGEHFGIVLHIGPAAFERMGGRAAWCEEGDTVVFSRYAGTRVEFPPGSQNFYQLMNDEDIYGKVC